MLGVVVCGAELREKVRLSFLTIPTYFMGRKNSYFHTLALSMSSCQIATKAALATQHTLTDLDIASPTIRSRRNPRMLGLRPRVRLMRRFLPSLLQPLQESLLYRAQHWMRREDCRSMPSLQPASAKRLQDEKADDD